MNIKFRISNTIVFKDNINGVLIAFGRPSDLGITQRSPLDDSLIANLSLKATVFSVENKFCEVIIVYLSWWLRTTFDDDVAVVSAGEIDGVRG